MTASSRSGLSGIASALTHISLADDQAARNKAVARSSFQPGHVVLRDPAFVTALSPKEKGRRCDYCHWKPTGSNRLLKCSGCATFWYCGPQCQKKQWKAHHRKLCTHINLFTASSGYQSLDPREQTDALLLSYFVAQVYVPGTPGKLENADNIAVFFDLMKGTCSGSSSLPFCGDSDPGTSDVARNAYSRFGNNNFVVHSHLTSYAHGIFPVASRLFNHSCYPNCVVKYIINPHHVVKMEVVAIRYIEQGEEMTIPYLDPALPLDVRKHALHMNYQFTCTCPLCSFQDQLGYIKPLPEVSSVRVLEDRLRAHVASQHMSTVTHAASLRSNTAPWAQLPTELCTLFNEAYLPQLSETFSRASHEGDYEVAISSGRTLSAYYTLVYPPNYPQIGMHMLELAKTSWNYAVSCDGNSLSSVAQHDLEDIARDSLVHARTVLEIFGLEGDEDGPMEEIRIMRELLHC